MDRMSPLDATFLHVEDGISHMHIASCAIFEGPAPAYEELAALFRSKLPLVPRYRQKVRFVPGALGRPVWVDDPHFNLQYHLRHTALAPPGDDEALRTLMGRLMSQPLDRHRPLWESWLVEGLTDGRWALISKVHHCMVDGISGTGLMEVILDHDREPDEAVVDRWDPKPEPTDAELVRHALEEALASPAEVVRWVRRAAKAPREIAASLRGIARGAQSLGDHLRPSPPLSIEGSIGPHRRWAWAETTIAEVKVIRSGLGGTVNDVVLTAITQGYRSLLVARGEDVAGRVLHTLVPVSVRAKDDHTYNNQVAAIIADLPIGIDDPVACLESLKTQMNALKASHQTDASAALFNLAENAPPLMFAGALHALAALVRRAPQRNVNTVTTNVPGPQVPLYACGREMLAYYPYVPITQGLRTGVAILSYNQRLFFGVTGDWDTMPDLAELASGIEQAFDRLTAASVAAQDRAAAKAGKAAKATKPRKRIPAA